MSGSILAQFECTNNLTIQLKAHNYINVVTLIEQWELTLQVRRKSYFNSFYEE
jgi:hypothetical protein